MTVHIPKYLVDLSERVGSTFVESVLGGMTASATLTHQPWGFILDTAAYATVFALGKGLLAYWTPQQGDAGLISLPAPKPKALPAPAATPTVGAVTIPVLPAVQSVTVSTPPPSGSGQHALGSTGPNE